MKLHQVLTGAVNTLEDKAAIAVGSVEDHPFTAYASGCDVVILLSGFTRVQIIPGSLYGYKEVNCVDCSDTEGKIAAAYGNKVILFYARAAPHSNNHGFPFHWEKSSELCLSSGVTCLSWDREGKRLLVGGSSIQLWSCESHNSSGNVLSQDVFWTCCWMCKPAMRIHKLQFSPDGQYFASLGKHDRLVKVWYDTSRAKPTQFAQHGEPADERKNGNSECLDFAFVYLPHPRAVTGISWRKTSKYMPVSSVVNALLTSCVDNICRVWCETVRQEPSSISVKSNKCRRHQEDGKPVAADPLARYQLESALAFHIAAVVDPANDLPLLSSLGQFSVSADHSSSFVLHWLNNKEIQFTMAAEMCLGAPILALEVQSVDVSDDSSADSEDSEYYVLSPSDEDDDDGPGAASPGKKDASIKLKSVLAVQDKRKESKLPPTPKSKTPLEYLKSLQEDAVDDGEASSTYAAVVSSTMGGLLHDWYRSPDTLLAVHPLDGSLLVWLVDWLDVHHGLPYRQAQVSFLSRIPNVLPPADANSLLQKLIVYCPRDDKIRALSGKDAAYSARRKPGTSKAGSASLNISRANFGSSSGATHPTAVMVSTHKDGALNHWQLAFADSSSFSTVVSVSHIARRCGHRFPITNILSHPELPLLLSTSSHEIEAKFTSRSRDALNRRCDDDDVDDDAPSHKVYCSELIVWRVESVSPLRQSGGVSELTRVNSSREAAFENIAWVPMLFSHSLISFESTKSLPAHAVAPCACFLASDGTCFRFYQVVLDARALQTYISNNSKVRTRSLHYSTGSNESLESLDLDSPTVSVPIGSFIESIVSRQSGSNPGCILKLSSLADSRGILREPLLLHVFSKKSVEGACDLGEHDPAEDKQPDADKSEEHFYVVGLELDKEAKTTVVYMWLVTVTTKPDQDAKASDPGQLPVYPEVLSRDSSVTSSRSASPLNLPVSGPVSCTIQSRKVCTQTLALPPGVVVTTATRAADKMSSAAVNPTCPAPYLFTTSCSDGEVRFWSCREVQKGQEVVWEELSMGRMTHPPPGKGMLGLNGPGEVLSISCAYTGRIATLCRRRAEGAGEPKTTDLSVCIWENESSGGRDWVLEDVLRLDCKFHEDESQVRLEWVCVEDGSHILTVCIGNEAFILACASRIANTSIRGESSSSGKETWVLLRNIHLTSENEWQLLTRALSWVRSGVLVVGLGTEMQIYSQWRPEVHGLLSPSDSLHFAPTVKLQKVTEQARGGMGELVDLSSRDAGHFGLFEEAAAVAPVLPQYHPKHLMELMNFGKLRRVRAILHHLVYCVAGREALDASAKSADQPLSRPRLSSMRSSSASSTSELEYKAFGEAEVKEGPVLVPALPLHELLAADKDTTCSRLLKAKDDATDSSDGAVGEEQDYSALFDTKYASSLESDDEDARLGGRKRGKTLLAHGSPTGATLTESAAYFGLSEARLLSYQLTKKQLPGLTPIEQLELLALADTFASTKLDLEESPGDIERGVSFAKKEADGFNTMGGLMGGPGGGGGGYATTGSIGATAGSGGDAVDECGLRFLLAMRHHTCLMRSLPPAHRAVLEEKGLSSSYFAWAFHSESEEELLAMMPAMLRGQPTWAELKEYGAGWWIRSNDTLRRLVEKVAKAQFALRQDPIDCALFYLAMKKKNVICGLYRTVRDTRMSAFFSHNFSEDRWRKAALKNAYSLLGKQRFNHAAAFFVLAGSLWDAVQVCVRRLGDIQLAMVVARLQDEDPSGGPLYQRILREFVLGDGGEISEDPFLRSIAYWVKQDYDQALETLMFEAPSSSSSSERKCNELAAVGNPDIFNFFLYLRTHPLLKRRRFKHAEPDSRKSTHAKVRARSASSKSGLADEVAFALRPMERQLFFKTSHAHLNSGCPALALQVLMELPATDVSEPETNLAVLIEPNVEKSESDGMIVTGTLGDFEFGQNLNRPSDKKVNSAEGFDWSQPVSSKLANDNAEAFDWSQPVSSKLANDNAEAFDWSKPVSSKLANDNAEAFDWSKPVSSKQTNDSSEAFDWSKPVSSKLANDNAEAFDWSKSVSSNGAVGSDGVKPFSSAPSLDNGGVFENGTPTSARGLQVNGEDVTRNGAETPENDEATSKTPRQLDTVAQQMKFSAILKLLLEGLHGIPASCEIADEDLRPFFLRWLEKELEVLHKMSDYGIAVEESDSEDEQQPDGQPGEELLEPAYLGLAATEKNHIALKIDRSARRLQWVKKNQTLLTILLNYCALHGASGGDLSAMNLELLLLLHEVEQTRSLVSPLYVPSAGPSVPPLILAAVSSYSLLASPIGYLQSLTQDILKFLFRLPGPPSPSNPVPMATVLSNLAGTLSDCIYQSLTGMTQEREASRRRRRGRGSGVHSPGKSPRSYPDSPSLKPTNSPAMWPGVRLLLSLLTSENRDNNVKLRVLLAEACVAIYLSLLALAWSACHSGQLYRVIVNPLKSGLWGLVFGGAVKVAQHPLGASEIRPRSSAMRSPGRARPESSDRYWNSARQRWNYKLLGHNPTEKTGDAKTTYVDQFVPPRTTLMEYFTTKPGHVGDRSQKQYDSDEEVDESSDEEEYESDGDDEHGFPTFRRKKAEEPKDHLDPDSYSWCLMNYSVSKLVLHNLQAFLPDVGFELTDLPSLSPRLHAVLKMLEGWQQTFLGKLDSFQGPPQDYISQFPVSEEGFPRGGPALMRYKALMDPYNTPFRSIHRSVEPVKRLWQVLTHQEPVRETFVRYIFKRESNQFGAEVDHVDAREGQKLVRILYKDTEGVNAFCVNKANPNCLTVGTLRDVQEVDISQILTPEPLAWMDEESETDRTEKKSEEAEYLQMSSTHRSSVVQSPGAAFGQSDQGSSTVLLKRSVHGTKRMDSHPHLPYYVTGSQDGSIRMWEFGHAQEITSHRTSGSHQRVTRVRFSPYGNKVGISDASGALSMWQVNSTGTSANPFLNLKCHNKQTNDFVFLGSSSFLATAGHSSDGSNVCLWDTLVPRQNALVQRFVCHENGAPCLAYVPGQQLLISGGRKGTICIFDLRQRLLLHTVPAHDAPIKSIVVDESEEFFISGSEDGDIKVWGLTVHEELQCFPREHVKSSYLKYGTQGVALMRLQASCQLYSCGGDGSVKWRQLPLRDATVNSKLF